MPSAHHRRSFGEMSWWVHAELASTPLIVVRAQIRNRPTAAYDKAAYRTLNLGLSEKIVSQSRLAQKKDQKMQTVVIVI